MKKQIENIALLVMRLQPPHLGHINLIYKAMLENDQVILLLGSSQEKRTKRNPLSTPEKIKILKQIFGISSKLKIVAIRDIGASTVEEWSNHVFETIQKAGLKQPNQYYGGDKVNSKFYNVVNPYTKKKMEIIELDRLKSGLMSGSDIRDSIYNGCNNWEEYVPSCTISLIKELYPKSLINPYILKQEGK